MARPVTVKNGTCFAFPDVLLTPAPPGPDVPIPYPNIAQLSAADGASPDVNAGGDPVVLEDSEIANSSGGEAGVSGGVTNRAHLSKCTFTSFSSSVKANGKGLVRQFDTTLQNDGNANGQVLAGVATVLVGD